MKICSVCNKKLTFRDSFVWEDQPICKSCFQEKTNTDDSKKRNDQKLLFGLPSWGLSLIVALTSFMIVMFLGYMLIDIVKDENIGSGIAYIIYDILIAIACFYICKNNPKSIWYVPIFCNIPGIISALVEPNFWITPLWMVICGGWVLSLIGAIIGANVGKRSILRDNSTVAKSV